MLQEARVLVADDDVDLLESIVTALEERGAKITRAVNGVELIEALAEQGPFDLMVVDVAMPWMSGIFAMHSARNAGMDAGIIVMTALPDADLPSQVRALGERSVLLRKPFDLSSFEETAEALLARGAAARGPFTSP